MLKNATSKDAMKLRMTGFECSPTSVIRLGPKAIPEGNAARHCPAKLVSVFHINLMSFPINFDVVYVVSMISAQPYAAALLLITQS